MEDELITNLKNTSASPEDSSQFDAIEKKKAELLQQNPGIEDNTLQKESEISREQLA